MSEVVTVIPTSGNDAYGDPVAQGTPVTLVPLEVAPGNTAIKYGMGGDLTDVEFTVYLPLRTRILANYYETGEFVKDGDEIVVRGRKCVAMVQIWRSQRSTGRGGLVVLARSKSGKAA